MFTVTYCRPSAGKFLIGVFKIPTAEKKTTAEQKNKTTDLQTCEKRKKKCSACHLFFLGGQTYDVELRSLYISGTDIFHQRSGDQFQRSAGQIIVQLLHMRALIFNLLHKTKVTRGKKINTNQMVYNKNSAAAFVQQSQAFLNSHFLVLSVRLQLLSAINFVNVQKSERCSAILKSSSRCHHAGNICCKLHLTNQTRTRM